MSDQRPAFYVALHGMPGFMPDHVSGPYRFDRRVDLTRWVTDELRASDFSDRSRRQVDLVRVWRWIQSNDSSGKCSFVIAATDPSQRGRIVEFRAMTAAEFKSEEESEYDA